MSMTFFMEPSVEVDVANPGYGQIGLFVNSAAPRNVSYDWPAWQRRPLVDEPWHRTLHGTEIGEFLDKLTERAFAPVPEPEMRARPAQVIGTEFGVHLPPFMKQPVAAALLPVFTKAALLALGGSERYDRTFRDPDEPPQTPLCVRCNLGTFYTPGAMANDWCEEYGHTPFGSSDGTSWQAATTHYERRRRWWEDDQARQRAQTAPAAIDLDAARRDRRPTAEG